MRRFLVLLLALGVFAQAEDGPFTLYGVRADIELPVDRSTLSLIGDPLGYFGQDGVFSVSGFIEQDGSGFEFRYRAVDEVSLAYYDTIYTALWGAAAQETSVGFRVGHRDGAFFARLRASVQISGVFEPP